MKFYKHEKKILNDLCLNWRMTYFFNAHQNTYEYHEYGSFGLARPQYFGLCTLQGEVVIEAGQDTSASLKKRHYNSHKKTLKYGGFLDCTSVQQQQEMGVVTEQRQDDDGARESEDVSHDLEGEWSHNVVAGGRIDDRILLEACGGRTAHKYVSVCAVKLLIKDTPKEDKPPNKGQLVYTHSIENHL